MTKQVGSLLAALLSTFGCAAAVLNVDVAAVAPGDGSAARPFKTIQQAADVVNPGDTVVIAPGVYFETVRLRRFGTASKPVTFRANKIRKNTVVVTGADPAIRRGEVKWKLFNAETGMWVADYAGPEPARVLYSGTDMFPYQSRDALATFEPVPGIPGPRHGFYYQKSGKKLYVRLRADGKYGSPDPNAHVMAVSPPRLSNGDEAKPDSRSYNFGLLGRSGQDLHVVIDGLTFETPGCSAIYVSGNHALIRNCYFTGCRAGGVLGRVVNSAADLEKSSRNITVEFCEWHAFPVYDDVTELATGVKSGAIPIDPKLRTHHWWVHKSRTRGVATPYEYGIVRQVGRNWTIRNCYVHDTFEAMANLNWGENTVFEDNVFERCVDNAIEIEDHSKNCVIRRNRFIDVWQSVSLQPLNGEPWAGPAYVYQNVFVRTPKNQFWGSNGNTVKIGVPARQWSFPKLKSALAKVDRKHVKLPGLLIFNNTIIDPLGRVFGMVGGNDQELENVLWYNNLVVAHHLCYSSKVRAVSFFHYVNNRMAWMLEKTSSLNPVISSTLLAGQICASPEEVLPNWRSNSPIPATFIPAVPVPGAPEAFKYIGALQTPDQRFAEKVGVQESAEAARP